MDNAQEVGGLVSGAKHPTPLSYPDRVYALAEMPGWKRNSPIPMDSHYVAECEILRWEHTKEAGRYEWVATVSRLTPPYKDQWIYDLPPDKIYMRREDAEAACKRENLLTDLAGLKGLEPVPDHDAKHVIRVDADLFLDCAGGSGDWEDETVEGAAWRVCRNPLLRVAPCDAAYDDAGDGSVVAYGETLYQGYETEFPPVVAPGLHFMTAALEAEKAVDGGKVTINGYDLVRTSAACPEQYDVFRAGALVGYLRLRHGHFSAQVPDVGGQVVYEARTRGDGSFDSDERAHFLTEAITAIDATRAVAQ